MLKIYKSKFYLLSTIIILSLEKVNYKIMIPQSFIIGLISGFIPIFGETLSLSRSFVFFPFYVLGYYAKDLDLFNKIKLPKVKKSTIIISIIILIVILCFDDILSIKILKGKYNYFDIDSITPIIAFLQRLLFYGAGRGKQKLSAPDSGRYVWTAREMSGI